MTSVRGTLFHLKTRNTALILFLNGLLDFPYNTYNASTNTTDELLSSYQLSDSFLST